jgi:hypothetical protein
MIAYRCTKCVLEMPRLASMASGTAPAFLMSAPRAVLALQPAAVSLELPGGALFTLPCCRLACKPSRWASGASAHAFSCISSRFTIVATSTANVSLILPGGAGLALWRTLLIPIPPHFAEVARPTSSDILICAPLAVGANLHACHVLIFPQGAIDALTCAMVSLERPRRASGAIRRSGVCPVPARWAVATDCVSRALREIAQRASLARGVSRSVAEAAVRAMIAARRTRVRLKLALGAIDAARCAVLRRELPRCTPLTESGPSG